MTRMIEDAYASFSEEKKLARSFPKRIVVGGGHTEADCPL